MEKQERKHKSKQKKTETKGIRLTMRTDEHDIAFKKKQAEKFLDKGHKIKVELVLKGREHTHLDIAKERLDNFIKSLEHPIKIEQEPKKQGLGLTMIISIK